VATRPTTAVLFLVSLSGAIGCSIITEADEVGLTYADDLGEDDDSESAPESSSEETAEGSESSADSDTGGVSSFRVAVLADPHVVGPDYVGGDENLEGTQEQLEILLDELSMIDPAPAFAVVLGDLVHDPYFSTAVEDYTQQPNAFATVDALFGELDFPVYPVFGESDYGVPEVERTFSHDVFAQVFATDRYYSVTRGEWRFIFANSQAGPTFEEMATIYDTGVGSFGVPQLTWIVDQLTDDTPTVLLTHFPVGQTAPDEAPQNEPVRGLSTVIGNQGGNLALILSGHTHIWANHPDTFSAPAYEFGATRYDTDNFLLFEFSSDGSFELLDGDKVQWGTPNADNWDYSQGPPVPVQDP